MSIVGVEGNSFSGKSELAKGLANYGYSVINEPSYYVDEFPSQPWDFDSARKNLDFFAEVEKRRSEEALKEAQRGNTVVMDRTLWTYVLYEYVLFKRFPEKPNVYEYSLDVFQRLSEAEDIVVPKVLLCLSPGSESVLRQRIIQRRPASIDFLNEWETTELIDYALEKIIGIYGPENALRIVNDRTFDELISTGIDFLNKSLPTDLNRSQVFNALRNI
ncbi:hypothetical protein HYV12_03080 [Candidatus Dojkabacteria bacterium]|nr:hypothetical protein [Candidatus Dojkabacteria bacterium]